MKHALVTGASGFVGRHLTRYLMMLGWNVAAYDLRMPGQNDVRFYQGDLSRDGGLLRAIQDIQPDIIFHLAGILKSNQPDEFYKAHVLGTVSLLDATIESGMHPRVLVASSSAVYGSGNGGQPIDEAFSPTPVTHYAVSKLAQELVALRYHTVSALDVICMRTFNLLGPGLAAEMAPSAFARQVAQVEVAGKPAQIYTGNLSAQRDYVDIRDAVRAYVLLAEHGIAGETYNICSGQAVSMDEVLQILLAQSRVPVEAILDPSRLQKNDVPIQIGDATKLKRATGWDVETTLQQSLVDLLADWREKVQLETL